MFHRKRIAIRRGAAATSLMLALALLTAMAQADAAADAARPGQGGDGPEIIVSGYRTSNAAAIEAKRKAKGITDSLAQDQAGLLPDLTIAQVAQRIPGVAMVPDFGTSDDRSSDLAESVMIRGIDATYNLVTIDGLPLATTAADSRGARIELLPPSFVARIDAVKTVTANLDPHALSGQLDLVIASAFDSPKPMLALRGSLGRNTGAGAIDRRQGANLRADVTYRSPFGANRDFGIILSGSHARFHSSNYDQKPGAVDKSYLIYKDGTNDQVDYTNITGSKGYSRGVPQPDLSLRRYSYPRHGRGQAAICARHRHPRDALCGIFPSLRG